MLDKDSYSLEEIYSYLSRFHLSDSLYTIGAINSALKYGDIGYYQNNIPFDIMDGLERYVDKGVSKLNLSLLTSRMARFLLLSGATDYREKRLKLGTKEFATAFNMIGRLNEFDDEEPLLHKPSWSKLFGRLSSWQFPLQTDRLIPIGRAYLLFIEIAQRSRTDYNYDQKMKEYFDLTVFEYLTCGWALWLTTNGVLDYEPSVEDDSLRSVITPANLQSTLKLITGTPQQYRKLILGDNWRAVNKERDLYALDPFLTIPAISVKQSLELRNDSFVVPQPKYLLDKISSGIFYLLADKERGNAENERKEGKKNSFRNSFGDVFREYVKIQLQQTKEPAVLIDLDNDFTNYSGGKKPDFALILDGICVLFEVKTTILKVEARTFFDDSTLEPEVKEGTIKKALNQLYTLRRAILNKTIVDSRFQNISEVVCVIACYEDIFVLNSTLLPKLKEHYGELAETLQLACISDIEAMGNYLSKGLNVGNLLCDKIINEEQQSHMIATVIESKIGTENQLLQEAFATFISRLGVSI